MRKHPKTRGPSIIRNTFRAFFASQLLFCAGAAYVWQNAGNRDFRYSMHKNCNWALDWYYNILDRFDVGSGRTLKEKDRTVWAERRQ